MNAASRPQRGFTLVELIVVIVISGILTLSTMQFISVPIDSYTDQSRRARLVGVAEVALDRISQDIHAALPNSLRVGCGGGCLEYLRTVAGGRYRAQPPGDTLSFNPADGDTGFDVLGPLSLPSGLPTAAGVSACADGQAVCLVVYNTGFAGTDAWQGDNIATVTALGTTSLSFNNSGFSSGLPAFPAHSPGQRFFVVDSPVTYLCDSSTGSLRRYEGYSIRASHSEVDSHAELVALGNPAEFSLVADGVSSCGFTYSPGSPSRNALLTVRLAISEHGETVQLLQQVSVLNGS